MVASGVQGLAEVLIGERTGLLVPVGDPAALAAAVGRLIDDPELRSRLADQRHADGVERFGTDCYADAMRQALARASAGRPGRPGRRFTRSMERPTRRFG